MNINTPVRTIYGDHFERFSADWKRQAEELRAKFGEAIEEVRFPREYETDVPVIYVKRESIVQVLEFTKSTPGFDYGFLADITATDEEVEPRFEVVYNLFSHSNLWRMRFKVRVRDGEEVPTLVKVWPGANWQEREIWDMFGVKFTGHPDLRRILMDERWVGHPLRKDYPLRGYQIFPDTQGVHTELLD